MEIRSFNRVVTFVTPTDETVYVLADKIESVGDSVGVTVVMTVSGTEFTTTNTVGDILRQMGFNVPEPPPEVETNLWTTWLASPSSSCPSGL